MTFNSRPFLRSAHFLPRFGAGTVGTHSNGSSGRQPQNRCGIRSSAQQLRAQTPTSLPSFAWWTSPFVLPTAAAAIMGGSLALFFSQRNVEQNQERPPATVQTKHHKKNSKGTAWVQDLANEAGVIKVLTAEALMAQDHPFLEDDHMFSAFVTRGIITDIDGFYSPGQKKFNSVVALGREVAGFPRVVHGGLTAAIFDESFGGLLFSLKKTGGINFWGPAYTVQLEVSYKSKIPAGATVLCSAEVDSIQGRKLWMKATMSDGPNGKVYATARALFVAPKPTRLAVDVVKYLGSRLNEVMPWNKSRQNANTQ